MVSVLAGEVQSVRTGFGRQYVAVIASANVLSPDVPTKGAVADEGSGEVLVMVHHGILKQDFVNVQAAKRARWSRRVSRKRLDRLAGEQGGGN